MSVDFPPLPPSLGFSPRFDAETGLPLGPSDAEWQRLTPRERDALQAWYIDAHNAWELVQVTPEGTAHADVQRNLYDRLRLHFQARRLGVFQATNLLVQSPEDTGFAPDLMVVFEVPLHHRLTWVSNAEGKVPDFVLECLHNGDRHKHLVQNVAHLARLGVPEYFVFDARLNRIHAWRLPKAGGATYLPVIPHQGFWRSEVLGLDLTVLDGEVHAYRDGSPLLSSAERIELLGRLLAEAQASVKAETEAAAEEARRAEEDRRPLHETCRAETAAARALAAIEGLRMVVRETYTARGWTLSAVQEAHLQATTDPAKLLAWATAATNSLDQLRSVRSHGRRSFA